ncbi:hypothetical protein BC827DRAFT_1156318 [Russula dissimulans]|nr:hypothetical protein BC827DRAFT_1156318 [Russula dissimulans]
MTTPLLEKLQIRFFNEFTHAVPHLAQFITTTENLRIRSARIKFFAWGVKLTVYPHEGSRTCTLYVDVVCEHLNWQVASAAQIFNSLTTVFSSVECLTLKYSRFSKQSGWNNEADHARWRELLQSFSNVKVLRAPKRLIRLLSRSLQSDGGDTPMELLPMLKELSFTGTEDAGDVFAPFIDAREIAGRPVSVMRLDKLRP